MKNCDVIEILLPNPRSTCWISWLGGGGKALPEKAKLCAYATRIPTPSSDLDKQKQIWSDQVCQSGMPVWLKVSKVPKIPSLFPFIAWLFLLVQLAWVLPLLVLDLIMWSREPTSEPLVQEMGRGWEWAGDIDEKVCKLVQKYHSWCFEILVLLAAADPLGLTTHTFVE